MKQKTMFIVALAVLLVVFVAGTLVYTAKQENPAGAMSEAAVTALGRLHAPMLGPMEAPVVIVEFLDPACGTCAAFYPRLKQIMAANPGKIRLKVRYAPFHNGSDKVVAALEASRKQDKFWLALEALLASQDAWAPNHTPQIELALQQLGGLGLDMDRLRADMMAPEVARVIAQDVADARTLNVTKTPEYFVNGRPLPSFGFEQLTALINEELRARGSR